MASNADSGPDPTRRHKGGGGGIVSRSRKGVAKGSEAAEEQRDQQTIE